MRIGAHFACTLPCYVLRTALLYEERVLERNVQKAKRQEGRDTTNRDTTQVGGRAQPRDQCRAMYSIDYRGQASAQWALHEPVIQLKKPEP